MKTNILPRASAALAEVFRLLGQPVRIQILRVIGKEDTYVGHIQAVLGIRQAAISQHLIFMRDAGLVMSKREGRHIFYHLANPKLIAAIYKVAAAAGVSTDDLTQFACKPMPDCTCPRCIPDMDPVLTSEIMRSSL